MRRLGRILLDTLTILSLLLALAGTLLWVRGYWRADAAGWTRAPAPAPGPGRDRPFIEIESGGGGAAVTVGVYREGMSLPGMSGGWWTRATAPSPVPYAGGRPANRLGLGGRALRFASYRGRRVVFPWWLATALFAALPAARLARSIRRRRRLREGHCANCDYDLRATSDRCPECGRVPSENRTAFSAKTRTHTIIRLRALRALRGESRPQLLGGSFAFNQGINFRSRFPVVSTG